MTAGDGKPCKRCGTSEWYKNGHCKECDRIRQREKHYKNPEKTREKRRRWRENNRELHRENVRRWRENNPDKVKRQRRRYRARKHNAEGNFTQKQFKNLCNQYGNRCVCCGKKKNLEPDHVVPLARGGTNDIANIQPLCRQCNASKRAKTIDYRTKPSIKRWIQRRLFDG